MLIILLKKIEKIYIKNVSIIYVKKMSSIINITNFINEFKNNTLEDFKKELYNNSLMCKYYEDEQLLLVYHKFNANCIIKNELEKECRSLVISIPDYKVISYTCSNPLCNKEAQYYLINQLNNNNNESLNVFKCYEGSLLSLFNHNNKWFLSTRRCLDANDSMWNNVSHYKMFHDVLDKENITFDEFTNRLNPNFGYYFVLIHYNNKQIIDYSNEFGNEYSKLCLAFVRNKDTQEEEIDMFDYTPYQNIFKPEKTTIEEFDIENRTLNPLLNNEGIIIKFNNNLLKLQTISYQFSKAQGSDSNIYKGYIYLYQIDQLKIYIQNYDNHKIYEKIINPQNNSEIYDTIGVVDSVFKVLTSELFELFKLLWKPKIKEHKNNELYNKLPKEYKDVLYGIRGIFFKLKTSYIEMLKNKTINPENNFFGIKDIYKYLKLLDIDQFCALLRQRKLMFNWLNIENTNPNLLLFKTISHKCDKVHCKLIAIFINKLYPEITLTEIPQIK